MGMTELAPGSVWNTMPAHVHSRRMEAYFYFEVPEEHAVCHFMGEVDETRHVWMKGDQAVFVTGVVYPFGCGNSQLYFYLGYGR